MWCQIVHFLAQFIIVSRFRLQILETDCHNFALPLWHLFFRNVPLSHEWIGLSILPTHFKFQSFINFTKILEFIPKDSWYLYYLPLNCILLLFWKIKKKNVCASHVRMKLCLSSQSVINSFYWNFLREISVKSKFFLFRPYSLTTGDHLGALWMRIFQPDENFMVMKH